MHESAAFLTNENTSIYLPKSFGVFGDSILSISLSLKCIQNTPTHLLWESGFCICRRWKKGTDSATHSNLVSVFTLTAYVKPVNSVICQLVLPYFQYLSGVKWIVIRPLQRQMLPDRKTNWHLTNPLQHPKLMRR